MIIGDEEATVVLDWAQITVYVRSLPPLPSEIEEDRERVEGLRDQIEEAIQLNVAIPPGWRLEVER